MVSVGGGGTAQSPTGMTGWLKLRRVTEVGFDCSVESGLGFDWTSVTKVELMAGNRLA